MINRLKAHWNFKEDKELGDYIGAPKSSISKYKTRSTTDLQTSIIIKLLDDIELLKTQIATDQDKIRLVVLEELAKQAGK